MLAFSLEATVHDLDLGDIWLVVDENANRIADDGENTTVGGAGSLDSSNRISFLEGFEVARPTHYVLSARVSASRHRGRLSITLPAADVAMRAVPVRGGAQQRTRIRLGAARAHHSP